MGNIVAEVTRRESADLNGRINAKRIIRYGVTGLVSGRKTVSAPGTAERLVAVSTPCVFVDISAIPDNGNYVMVGDSSTLATDGSEQGVTLYPTTNPYRFYIDDVNKLFVDVTAAGEGVCFVYYTL